MNRRQRLDRLVGRLALRLQQVVQRRQVLLRRVVVYRRGVDFQDLSQERYLLEIVLALLERQVEALEQDVQLRFYRRIVQLGNGLRDLQVQWELLVHRLFGRSRDELQVYLQLFAIFE